MPRPLFLLVAATCVVALLPLVDIPSSSHVAAPALTPPLLHLTDSLDAQTDGTLDITDGVVTLSNEFGAATLGLPAHASNITVTSLHGNGVRFLARLNSSADPTTYVFPLTLPPDVTLYQASGGGVAVRGPGAVDTDPPVAWIEAPFAVDATGRQLPVTQTVTEHDITLTIDHTDAVYPVLADPSYYALQCVSFNNDASTMFFLTWTQQCPYGFTFIMATGYWPVSSQVNGRSEWWNIKNTPEGECSYISDTGPDWDWQVPCKAHDYCYDLYRVYPPFNYPNVAIPECNYLFMLAAGSDCSQRFFLAWINCFDFLWTFVNGAFALAPDPHYSKPSGGWFW